jgi:predicted double-glycine peptidase
MNRLAASIAAAALAVATGALAGPVELPLQIGGAYVVPVKSIREARFAATIRQQYDFSCGSAALATLLSYQYQFPVTEDVVFEEMFRLGDQAKIKVEGFSLLDMKRYLEAHGFEADGFQEPLERLASAGIPAIVLVNEHGYNHFVVVKGVRDGRVLIGDPAGGTRVVSRAAFQEVWANGILFVIGNRRDVASFNAESDWHAAPRAPVGDGVDRGSLAGIVMPKLGPADF